jgi:hypothetical protein
MNVVLPSIFEFGANVVAIMSTRPANSIVNRKMCRLATHRRLTTRGSSRGRKHEMSHMRSCIDLRRRSAPRRGDSTTQGSLTYCRHDYVR